MEDIYKKFADNMIKIMDEYERRMKEIKSRPNGRNN
jgi:hypothetical protein